MRKIPHGASIRVDGGRGIVTLLDADSNKSA
jgi:hypothetical protein